MANGEYIFLIIVGGVFLVLGLAAMFWGQREEKSYFNDIATRADDLREFMDHWPSRPQPGALKLGGWLAIIIGILLGGLGLIMLLLNQGAL